MILSIWVFIAVLVVAWEREGWGSYCCCCCCLSLACATECEASADDPLLLYLSPPTRLTAKTPMMTTVQEQGNTVMRVKEFCHLH